MLQAQLTLAHPAASLPLKYSTIHSFPLFFLPPTGKLTPLSKSGAESFALNRRLQHAEEELQSAEVALAAFRTSMEVSVEQRWYRREVLKIA